MVRIIVPVATRLAGESRIASERQPYLERRRGYSAYANTAPAKPAANAYGSGSNGFGGKDTTPCHMAYQKFDADKYYNNTALGYIYHKNGWGTSYGCKASFACEYDKMQDWLYPGEDILKAFDELWDDLGPHARCGYATTHSGCSVQLYPCNDNRFGKECKDEEYSVPADEWEL